MYFFPKQVNGYQQLFGYTQESQTDLEKLEGE